MIRTQIYIPEEEHRELLYLAKKSNKPMAKIVRKFIRQGLEKEKKVDYSGKTILRNLLKMKATGGPKDLSTNIDHYLYGAPKKKT